MTRDEALRQLEKARDAVTQLRDAVRVGQIIEFRQRDPLVLAIHRALDHLAALLDAARPSEAPWQPIETAPTDREVLLTDGREVSFGGKLLPEDMGVLAHEISDPGWWNVGGITKPTHWMPLPAPPAITGEEKK